MKIVSLIILLMFLGMVSSGIIMETTAVSKYFDRSRVDFRERESMKDILDNIVLRFNDLLLFDFDDEQNPVLESIRSGYADYNLTINDISSGCNLNFLPDSFLSDSSLANFLFSGGNAEAFLMFRRNHGFVTDKSVWEQFVKEEVLSAVVCYGWFSIIHKDSETSQMVAVYFGKTEEDLYPVINDLPLININTIDQALITPLLSNRSLHIPEVASKAASLRSRIEQSSINEGELRALLNLEGNHDVYRYLGVRTAFWAISYRKGNYRMDAVIAAVPERGSKTIKNYTLIEGRLSREIQ